MERMAEAQSPRAKNFEEWLRKLRKEAGRGARKVLAALRR